MAEDNKKELINECQEKYAELIKQTVIKALVLKVLSKDRKH